LIFFNIEQERRILNKEQARPDDRSDGEFPTRKFSTAYGTRFGVSLRECLIKCVIDI
jgi:hypothetical protein